jgi:hypothetical protein
MSRTPTLSGLSPGEAAMSAEAYFDLFEWDPPEPDPNWMSAADFLGAL